MSIDKSQGHTFQHLGLYLPNPVFSHGQLYVACSRIASFAFLSIYLLNKAYQGSFDNFSGVYTKNIVFPSIIAKLHHLSPLPKRNLSSDSILCSSPSTNTITKEKRLKKKT